MSQEKRIEILEKEVEVLKNQIQGILLDIREQLLTNTYPTLRAENLANANVTESANKRMIPAFDVPQDNFEADHDSSNGAMPAVNRVTLDSLQQSRMQERPVQHAPMNAPQSKKNENNRFIEIEQWLDDQLQLHGPDYAREIVHQHAMEGRLSQGEYESLLGTIEIYENRMSITPQFAVDESEFIDPPAWLQEVNKPKRKKPATQSKKSQQPRPVAETSVTKPSKPATKSAQSKPKTAPAAPPQKEPSAVSKDEDDQDNSVVLRLIAGIQNAGAGITWKKRHG